MLHTPLSTRCFPVGIAAAVLVGLSLPVPASAQVPPAPQPVTGPITKDQAVALAVAHNQSLRAARLGIDQSRAGEITASLKPNPVFTSVNQDFPVFTPSQLTWTNLANNQSFAQSLSYVVERGGKRDRRIQVARDTTEMTARTVDDAERQLRFQVGQAFVGVLLAKANLESAQADLKDFTQVVELNRQRVASGDLAEGDFLKIELQMLQFQQDVAAAEIALVQGKASLRQLLGYEIVPADFDVAGTLAHPKAAVTLQVLQNEATSTRPDLLAARANTKVAQGTLDLARANRARDVTFEVEYDRNGPVNGIGGGVSFELPIHDRNQGEIARSQFALSQARESEGAALATVLTDVVNAFAGYETNEKVASLFESGYLAQAQQSRDISRYSFAKGASALLDLLDAERTYRATELSYRQALAALMTSVEQLNFAVGKQVIQ